MFCHGTPWSSALWQRTAGALSEDFTVHLWDMLGYGASTMAEDLDMLVAPWVGDVGQAAFYRQIAQADQRHTDEIEGRYSTLDLPVAVIWGAEDTWIPVDRAHRLAGLIPGAELHVVPQAGHLIQLDAPEELTALLQRWLLTCPTAG